MQAADSKLLKKDVFGDVILRQGPAGGIIVRDIRNARPWARWLARRLLEREARALAALDGMPGVPQLVRVEAGLLERSWIDGAPMHEARPGQDRAYFRAAARLLRRLHRHGVVHNDLAKEPNWLVTAEQEPAIVDFQLAWHARDRGFLFRLAGREDLRHLLKHKRTYCPDALTARERSILDNPTMLSRLWSMTGKKLYLVLTRGVLGWSDREGARDRGARH